MELGCFMAVLVMTACFGQRNRVDLAMPNPPQRNQLAGASLNGRGRTAENDCLQAIVVIEVGVKRADDEVMVLMLQVQQAVGDRVLVVVVDVSDRGDAPLDLVGVHQCAAEPFPDQVAHGFRPVHIAAQGDQPIEILCQVFVQGNGESLHLDSMYLGRSFSFSIAA